MMRSMMMRICSSLSNRFGSGCSVPPRSKNAEMQPFTMISVTVSSSSSGWSGPKPTTSSSTSSTIFARVRESMSSGPCVLTTASITGRSSSRERAASGAFAMRATSANPTRSIISRFAVRFAARCRSCAWESSSSTSSNRSACCTRSSTLIAHQLPRASRAA